MTLKNSKPKHRLKKDTAQPGSKLSSDEDLIYLDLMARLQAFSREKKLPLQPVRRKILSALVTLPEPFTAQQAIDRAQQSIAKLSPSSVYRALSVFAQAKLLSCSFSALTGIKEYIFLK